MRLLVISLFGFVVIAAIGIISFCDGKSNVLCIDSERKALLKLKHDLIDPSNRLSTWVDADQEDCCKWAGVVCNNLTGHVNELHLGSDYPIDFDEWNSDWEVYSIDPETLDADQAYLQSRLRGKINPSLLHLKHLSFLDLSDSDFGGMQIPELIGSLKSLVHLDLSSANLSGAIPHQLANLSKLQYLDLGYNSFPKARNPSLQWVCGLSSLQYLDLSSVNLSQVTDLQQVTNKLPSLVELHLSLCSLSNVPHSLVSVNHTNLALLDLSVNSLTSIPTWIFSLSSLKSIDLRDNRVGGVIPNGFQNLSSLKYLDLRWNPFSSSSIPNWLSNLNHLQFLDLHHTRLQGNIQSFNGNLSSVTYLDLSENKLEGIVPKFFESLCSLRLMDLSHNSIDQEVSKVIESLSICSLDTLETLNLGHNNLSGHLTEELGQFKNLAKLGLSGNAIDGPIPFSIGKLSSLKILDVSYNLLNGSLPLSLAQLENIEFLDFSNNMIQGIVSEIHFANLTRLRALKASNNMLTFKPNPSWIPPFHCHTIELGNWYLGPQFPRWLQFQKNISDLDISCVGISDVVPTWFWNLSTQFFYLNISHNQLDGGISYWPESAIFDLSSNRFTGSLPQVSPNLGSLFLSRNSVSGSLSHFLTCNVSTEVRIDILDLGSNLLSGKIPDCWKNWYGLEVLNLENNSLTGEIPRSLGYMPSVVSLNLRRNSLFGEVPSTLQHLAILKILDLSENQLNGSIPAWIGDRLSQLIVLNFRSNKFQSDVPENICALQSLQVLDLGSNNISGAIPKCFSNLSAMTNKTLDRNGILYSWGYNNVDSAFVVAESLLVKGREDAYSITLGLVTSMDLSANSLAGEIPKELGNLKALLSLNLSRNLLTGKIPENIGKMESLESLDLSMNWLNGEIPSSLSNLNFLSQLNLSYNNLTEQIPTGTQLQSFDEFSYIGNHFCGPPVSKSCTGNGGATQNNVKNGDGTEGSKWSKFNGLYVCMVLGFVMGFWGVVAPLFFIKSWRFAYYQKLDDIGRKLYVFWATSCRRSFSCTSPNNKNNEGGTLCLIHAPMH